MKIKNFSAKNNVKGMKREASNWEKTFAKDRYNKVLLPKRYKKYSENSTIRKHSLGIYSKKLKAQVHTKPAHGYLLCIVAKTCKQPNPSVDEWIDCGIFK